MPTEAAARRRAAGQAVVWLLAAMVNAPAKAVDVQSREDAWWTGPMLAASGATLPQGHALVEPYLFDIISSGHFDTAGTRHATATEHDLGSLTYILYGVTDRLTAGLIPRFFYNMPPQGPTSSGIGAGDLTLQAAYGISQYQDGHRTPSVSLVIDETLPTGAYDQLDRASDGTGAGAYSTGFSVYSQQYFWMPNGRILRGRLDLTYTVSSSASLSGQSVYGTAPGFHGHASPGDGLTVDAAAEYSITREWVAAMDVVYQHNDSTHLQGADAAGAVSGDSGASWSLGFAPAIEYNWSARAGVLLGVRIIEVGRNTSASITPAVAVNMVF
ncbi:MAG: transporter [Proteobacteria bacterium]|nr:transporter [Pseudomonadota bacterium]